ncbi:MAG: hypothetical protein K6V73_04600 [Firmicutes bacterium]|nr:hypothetical protein [Bacillota bacterium]
MLGKQGSVDLRSHVLAVEGARRELEAAQQWFEWVTEPRLVDEAIYRLRAAELRLAHAMGPMRKGEEALRAP